MDQNDLLTQMGRWAEISDNRTAELMGKAAKLIKDQDRIIRDLKAQICNLEFPETK